MIAECREYLVDKVIKAGIKTNIRITMKDLKASNESHIGAVLFEDEEFEINIKKTNYVDEEGNKQKRTKMFDRKTSFSVVIGEYEQSKCEIIFENFMKSIGTGLYIDNNYIEISPKKASWVDKDDSILKSKVAVQVLIEFDGGIYKDTGFKKVNDIGVDVEIQKEG